MKSAHEAARQKRHTELKLKELAQKKQKLLDEARRDAANLDAEMNSLRSGNAKL